MSDAVGLLTFPVAAPTVYPSTERTLTPGDPALVQLASFAATVLQTDCGDAWAALSPGKPEIVASIDGTLDGDTAARKAFFDDPRQGFFEPSDLPALFVFRAAQTTSKWMVADAQRLTTQVVIAWLFPPSEEDRQRRERAPFMNAIRAAMQIALTNRRHPSWVADSDAADVDGIKTSFATSTGAAVITTFNGAMAADTLLTGRRITFKTAASVGAYNIADPIAVVGTLDNDLSHTEYVYLTDADGGETVKTIFPFTLPTSVSLPAMGTANGAIEIGYDEPPDIRKGSLIQRACGFREMRFTRSMNGTIQVEMPDGSRRPFHGIEFFLDVSEDTSIDRSARTYEPWDIEAHGTSTHPSDDIFEILIED